MTTFWQTQNLIKEKVSLAMVLGCDLLLTNKIVRLFKGCRSSVKHGRLSFIQIIKAIVFTDGEHNAVYFDISNKQTWCLFHIENDDTIILSSTFHSQHKPVYFF